MTSRTSTIQLKDTSPENFNKTDVFRIEFQRYQKSGKGKTHSDHGVREVTATFLPGRSPKPPGSEPSFEQTSDAGQSGGSGSSSAGGGGGGPLAAEYRPFGDEEKARSDFLVRVAIAVAFMSTLGLMIPLTGDSDSIVPDIFHLTPQFKQVLAFASGMSIGFILRQQF